MKRVLVTGAAGFLGEEIVNYFNNKKYLVLAISHRNKKYFNKRIIQKKIDLTKKFKINFSPDLIIHCASKMPTRGHIGSKMYKDNIKMMKSILHYAKIKKTKYIFNMSSMSVYGTIKTNLVDENQKFIKPDMYGKSKYVNEKLLEDFTNKFNILAISLRLPGVVGLNSHSNFISNIIKKLINNENILAFNKNSKFNNILLASDVAKFIDKIIKKKLKKKKYFNFNIASKNPIKLKFVLNTLIKKLNSKSNIIWSKSKKKSFLIKFDRIKKIGFKPCTTKNLLLKLSNIHINKLKNDKYFKKIS